MAEVELNPPTRRTCQRCGREDVWDDETIEWRIRTDGDRKLAGNPFCLHEWDITGTHKPVRERS